jgi:hypothetical protein
MDVTGARMLITLSPAAPGEELVAYLQRLGCTVGVAGADTLLVHVTHPETVDDEAEAIRAWCAAWARHGRRELVVDDADAQAA